MKRISQKHRNYTLPLAFAIPCVGMLMVMIIAGYEPFGTSAILYSDNYHQYFPFFKAFREHLRSGGSLLNIRGLLLAAVILLLTNGCKKTKNLHPVVFIALSAAVGILFGFGT